MYETFPLDKIKRRFYIVLYISQWLNINRMQSSYTASIASNTVALRYHKETGLGATFDHLLHLVFRAENSRMNRLNVRFRNFNYYVFLLNKIAGILQC